MCIILNIWLCTYRIHVVENFGEVLSWRFGEFGIDRQIKNSPTEVNARAPVAVTIQIVKFKLCQYQWRAISPNLMLTKVTRYMVCASCNIV